MKLLKNLGKNIKNYRLKYNLSQEELAYRLSINLSNISRIENGQQFLSAQLLQLIADVFDIPVSKLFEEENNLNIKKNTNKEKLINYLKVLSDDDIKYFIESFKLYIKYKNKSK